MEEVPFVRALMRAFYAEGLGALSPEEVLADVARHAPLLERALADLPLPEGGLLVDVGTGAGLLALAAALRHPRARVEGYDLAVEAVARAAEAARRAGLAGARFGEADAEALPVADGAADVVACASAMNLFPSKRAFLAEARRVLRPGGTLLVLESFRGRAVPAVEAGNAVPAVEAERAVEAELAVNAEDGSGPVTHAAFVRLLDSTGFAHAACEDATEVRRALDAAKVWRYPPFVHGFEYRVERAVRR